MPPLDAHAIARRLGLQAPDEATLARLDDALTDAEADVVGYLGRPIRPQTLTAYHLYPDPHGGWDLPESPVIEVVSAVAETYPGQPLITTGLFTVTYRAGLDYENDPNLAPIKRYVIAAVRNDPTLLAYLERTGAIQGAVKSTSVSTEGQSKSTTYAAVGEQMGGGGTPGSDSPGALPSKSTLDRWRRAGRRVAEGHRHAGTHLGRF